VYRVHGEEMQYSEEQYERYDVKSAHIGGRDMRNRSKIRLNVSKDENKKRDENVNRMRHASALRCQKEWEWHSIE